MRTKNFLLFSLLLIINSAYIVGMEKNSTSTPSTQEGIKAFLEKRLPRRMPTPSTSLYQTLKRK